MYYMMKVNTQVWKVETSKGNTTEEVYRGSKDNCFKFMKTGEVPPKPKRKKKGDK